MPTLAQLARAKDKYVDPREVQAMFADVAGSAGIPLGHAAAMALRGKAEEAKKQAAIEAALLGLPAAGPLARLAGRGAARAIDEAMMSGEGPLAGLVARPAFAVNPDKSQLPLDLGMKPLSPGYEKALRIRQVLGDRVRYKDAHRYEMEQGAEPMNYDRWLEEKLVEQKPAKDIKTEEPDQPELFADGGSVSSPGFNFEHISLLADAL